MNFSGFVYAFTQSFVRWLLGLRTYLGDIHTQTDRQTDRHTDISTLVVKIPVSIVL